MKRNLYRFCSSVLIFSTVLSVSSCGKLSDKNVKKISEDDPWFDTNIIDVDTGAEKGRALGSWLTHFFIGMDDQYYIIETRGDYQTPPEDKIDWETYNYKDYQFDYLAVIDRNTKQTVNTIDIKKDLTLSEYHVDNAYFRKGIITVNTSNKERDYDPLTGELLDTRSRVLSEEDAYSNSYSIGDYEVETVVYQTGTNHQYTCIRVTSPDGKTSETELNRVDKNIYASIVLAVSETKVVIPATVGKEEIYYELDLTTNELTAADSKEYEWLDSVVYFDGYIPEPDGTLCYKNGQGIYRVNAKIKKAEEVFNHNQCGLNSGLIDRFELVECSENSILLLGLYDITTAYEGRTADKVNLIEITGADKNPHAGKTVLEIYSPREVDAYTGDAVARFNETNEKYFIEYSNRYNKSDFYDDSFDKNNEDVGKLANLNTTAGLSNKLAIDIMNGDGPDILLDCSSYSRLYNSNCLTDLTPFVKDADPDKYFTNIIEGSKTDGAIYQLPISFGIEGIATKIPNSGRLGQGFTLDEYVKFSDEVMNGKDPLYFGQAIYFSMLFNSMKEDYISNGKVDLSKPEFKILADYVRDNVRENGISKNDWYQSATGIEGVPPGEYVDYCSGIGGFFQTAMGIAPWGKGVTILGIPSLDGRGPRFIPGRSVAISSQAVDVKACGEFVKLLLTEEFQTKIAMTDTFVINRKAFKNAGSAAIQYYNNGGSSFNGGSGSSALGIGKDISTDNVNFIENIILSCSKIKTEDSDISIILIEEMPAYFTGQKELNAVIEIAGNRIQKVLDERG